MFCLYIVQHICVCWKVHTSMLGTLMYPRVACCSLSRALHEACLRS